MQTEGRGMLRFLEFFAGGGMARAGLGSRWTCLFANDFDPKKCETYRDNWGTKEIVHADIRNLSTDDFPGTPDLVWGSFPCQDLSLAGGGAGLRGDRSGTFWPFMSHMKSLSNDGRPPTVIALENVVGTLTSHGGKDFQSICRALKDLGYRYGCLIVDAALFVPQSRPRVFFIATLSAPPPHIETDGPRSPWHTPALRRAYDGLSDELKSGWVWWNMPRPAIREMRFADLIEERPQSVRWHSKAETTALLSMMSEVNLAKVHTAKASGVRMVGGIYKRTRWQQGVKVQRAEIRFDDIAGCLRTPAGGSSRQLIMVVEGEDIRSRLISARETARLMGLPDSFKLPAAYNEAYHLTGDGVAVPVVRYIAKHIIERLILPANQFGDGNFISTLREEPNNSVDS